MASPPVNKAFCEKVGTDVQKLEFRNQTGMPRWVGMESGASCQYLTIPAGESYLCMCSPWVKVMHADARKPLILHTNDRDQFQHDLTTTKITTAGKETYIMSNTSGKATVQENQMTKLNYDMEWWSGGACWKDHNKRNTCTGNHWQHIVMFSLL